MRVERESTLNSSNRRNAAIKPYLESSKWRVYESLPDFKSRYGGSWESGEVRVLNQSIDFSVRPKSGSTRLAVIFNSQQKAGAPLKLFTWEKAAERIGCSRLHISDPVLNTSEELTLGWYTSNQNGEFQKPIRNLIENVADKLGCEELVFLGSSGGGLPASVLSQYFPNSLSLLLAPTFSIPGSLRRKPNEIFLKENSADDIDTLKTKRKETDFDLFSTLDRVDGLQSNIQLLQSRGDLSFWKYQTQPLLRKLGYDLEYPPQYIGIENLHAHFGDWGKAHTPPPADLVYKVCESVGSASTGSLMSFSILPLTS